MIIVGPLITIRGGGGPPAPSRASRTSRGPSRATSRRSTPHTRHRPAPSLSAPRPGSSTTPQAPATPSTPTASRRASAPGAGIPARRDEPRPARSLVRRRDGLGLRQRASASSSAPGARSRNSRPARATSASPPSTPPTAAPSPTTSWARPPSSTAASPSSTLTAPPPRRPCSRRSRARSVPPAPPRHRDPRTRLPAGGQPGVRRLGLPRLRARGCAAPADRRRRPGSSFSPPWASARPYRSNEERRRELPRRLHRYNARRPRGGIAGVVPASRT